MHPSFKSIAEKVSILISALSSSEGNGTVPTEIQQPNKAQKLFAELLSFLTKDPNALKTLTETNTEFVNKAKNGKAPSYYDTDKNRIMYVDNDDYAGL